MVLPLPEIPLFCTTIPLSPTPLSLSPPFYPRNQINTFHKYILIYALYCRHPAKKVDSSLVAKGPQTRAANPGSKPGQHPGQAATLTLRYAPEPAPNPGRSVASALRSLSQIRAGCPKPAPKFGQAAQNLGVGRFSHDLLFGRLPRSGTCSGQGCPDWGRF